ncbi:MAG: NnrS family protein [Burkholderiales bacterium]|nr:NnrS family protein [Burkholderiales bacterium]
MAAAAGPRKLVANVAFYPAAAAYGALALPASTLSLLGIVPSLPGFTSPAGHAHEMLFGFALAVISGNQLGPMSPRRLWLFVAFWAAARVAFLCAPLSPVSAVANAIYPALLAWQLAPRLLGSAKKLRNQALPLALTAICGSAIAFQFALRSGSALAAHALAGLAVLFVSVLMLFMGGRLIAPAVAGQFQRQGGRLSVRVQPRIEGGLILAMALAALAWSFADKPAGAAIAAAGLVAAGSLAAVRLLRWRLWALRGRPDLLCLAAGYAWLACGLIALGIALAAGRQLTTALHLVTVGSLGTLTLNVMALTRLLKARRQPSRSRLPVWGTLLVAVAVLARVTAGLGLGDTHALLVAASVCWSAAFVLLLALLLRGR